MKKQFVLALAMTTFGCWFVGKTFASEMKQTEDDDSLRLLQLQEVVVKGVWAQKNAPFATHNIKKAQLGEFSKTGKELPTCR